MSFDTLKERLLKKGDRHTPNGNVMTNKSGVNPPPIIDKETAFDLGRKSGFSPKDALLEQDDSHASNGVIKPRMGEPMNAAPVIDEEPTSFGKEGR